MNVVKKVIALITVVLIVIRFAVISVSASFAAGGMIAAEELTEVIGTLLFSSGAYTQEQINGMSLYEMESNLKNGLNNGTIDPARVSESIPFYDDSSGTWIESIPIYGGNSSWSESIPKIEDMSLWDVFCYFYNIPNSKPTSSPIVEQAKREWLAEEIKNGTLRDKLHNAPSFDLNGHGGAFREYTVGTDSDTTYGEFIYFDKMIITRDSSGMVVSALVYRPDSEGGNLYFGSGTNLVSYLNYGCGWAGANKVYYNLYGDVVYQDNTPVETDEELIPVVGEVDGTQVTPDMLNPDGTVTIDGTTYYPKDFIDWDKFKDPAIIDLLDQILDAIDNSYVYDDSVPDSIPSDVAVEVPAELSDFTTPGIANVFPFCLPWDFVRGMQLLSAEPEVPHFEKEITIPAFLNVPEQKWKFEIDFKEFEPLAKITRWCSLLSFIYTLILITPKIAKGA